MMGRMLFAAECAARKADDFLTKHRLVFAALLGALLSALLAVYNILSGPLSNLNDIGGWSNRALFILMSAFVHASMLMLCALLSRVCFSRVALRQVILTAGFFIMLLAINQKAYVYVNVLQPLVRAMDGSFAAGMQADTPLAAPARLLVYLITRGPVYDMYLLKLFAIACCLLIALLITRAADRNGLGIRAEVLLALCMILPQGFMNAACSALPEIAAVAALGVSLTLCFGMNKPRQLLGTLCYGAACALSGACLCALPAYVYLVNRGRMTGRQLAAGALVMLALCVPAVIGGMPAVRALCSLFDANLGMPMYASGAPGVVHLIPRALVEETPQYAATLRHLPQLDFVTHAQEYYTQEHFVLVMRGFALAGIAAYLGICALMRASRKDALTRVLTLVLAALIVCPGVTSAAWLAVDVLCLYAILARPQLRLPSCLVLFATMTSSSYPMTEEVMLPMIAAFALCFAALLMLLDVIPAGKEETIHEQ